MIDLDVEANRRRYARVTAGLSISGMALKMNWTTTAVGQFERCKLDREGAIKHWAEICGVTFAWLERGTVSDAAKRMRNHLDERLCRAGASDQERMTTWLSATARTRYVPHGKKPHGIVLAVPDYPDRN